MSMVEFNRTEVEVKECGVQKGKMQAFARTEGGGGWMIPLRDMTPNDLRKVADIMEGHGIGSDEFGGLKVC